jgi:hypothetical protein
VVLGSQEMLDKELLVVTLHFQQLLHLVEVGVKVHIHLVYQVVAVEEEVKIRAQEVALQILQVPELSQDSHNLQIVQTTEIPELLEGTMDISEVEEAVELVELEALHLETQEVQEEPALLLILQELLRCMLVEAQEQRSSVAVVVLGARVEEARVHPIPESVVMQLIMAEVAELVQRMVQVVLDIKVLLSSRILKDYIQKQN